MSDTERTEITKIKITRTGKHELTVELFTDDVMFQRLGPFHVEPSDSVELNMTRTR